MTAKAKHGCPICGRPPEAAFKPFCSKRCADVDLGRWLGERYVVSEPAEPEEKPGQPAHPGNDDED